MALPNDTAIQTRCLRSYVSFYVRCSVPGPGPGSYSMAPTYHRMRVHCRLFVVAFSVFGCACTRNFLLWNCFLHELFRIFRLLAWLISFRRCWDLLPRNITQWQVSWPVPFDSFACVDSFIYEKCADFGRNAINNGKADRISFLNLAFPLPRPPFTEYSMTGDQWVDQFPSIHLLMLTLSFTETCADFIRIRIHFYLFALAYSVRRTRVHLLDGKAYVRCVVEILIFIVH